LIDFAIKVADDFQVHLGKSSIPKLLKDSTQNFDNLWVEVANEINNISGRIVIDLQENSRFIWFEKKTKDLLETRKDLLEIKLNNKVHYLDLIPLILDQSDF
jgi:hypothetical protein